MIEHDINKVKFINGAVVTMKNSSKAFVALSEEYDDTLRYFRNEIGEQHDGYDFLSNVLGSIKSIDNPKGSWLLFSQRIYEASIERGSNNIFKRVFEIKEAKKLTVSEIEKILGYEIEIVEELEEAK